MNSGFDIWSAEIQSKIELALDSKLPAIDHEPRRLHAAIRHSALGGGKRVRPLLTHAAGALSSANDEALEYCSCAVEAIHVYSLIHDDLPCMDNDTLRRGRPTCHVAFDEATALLAGDALQALAFEWLAACPCPADRRVEMIAILAHAAGPAGMAGGQAIDLAAVGEPMTLPGLEYMHALKTGALIRAAVLLGAAAGPTALTAEENASLDRFAKRAGLLFQVVDDILDCTANTATLGKTAGKDQAADKPTYVSLLGLAEARSFAADLRDEARAALESFGDRARRLLELCEFIAHRTF